MNGTRSVPRPELPAMHRPHRPTSRSHLPALGLLALLVAVAACGPVEPEEPRLAVVLAVDQLTPHQLELYGEVFDGGFRRLLDQGFSFDDAVHDHAITYTSPGHASSTTGVVPARHGIVSNSWREWHDGEWVSVSSVADPDTDRVGGSGSGSSPVNLLVDGLPDWLLRHRPQARVVSLSGKSTAGVLMGGRAERLADGPAELDGRHIYWYSVGDEGFVTSSHYRDRPPDWVEEFNRTAVERFGGDGCWESELDPETAALSRRDTARYEADGVHTHFPHCEAGDLYRSLSHFISRTPALDQATLALAREAVRQLELGQGEAPDYLALALSSTDRVGHSFGPYSREQLANLVRLDNELESFFYFLDETVGEDRYVVVLTSDHGVLPLPEYLQERGEFGLRLTGELNDSLRAAAQGLEPLGAEFDGAEAAEARAELATRLQEVDWIEEAMPLEVLASDEPADSMVVLYRNSFHPERLWSRVATYGVETRLSEGVLVRSTGTTHGVPYLHDRRVPLIFMGDGIEAGTSPTAARTVDLPPTLARILGVPVPEGLDGRVLLP